MCLLLPNGTVENNMIRTITITITATATDINALNYCMVMYYYYVMSGSL